MKKILVTGATGFIGKHLVPVLMERGDTVVAIVRTVPEEPIAGVQYQAADLMEASAVRSAAAAIGPVDATVHLAARIPHGPAGQNEDPLSFVTANINGLANLLAAFGPSVGQFIYVSSIDVYGNSPDAPYQETQLPTPATTYGGSKLAGEDLVRGWASEQSVPATILRLSQVYGAGEAMVKVIPRFIEKIRAGEPLVVAGGGMDKRRYVAAADVVRAIVCAIDTKAPGTFNIAGEEVVSIRDLIATFERVLGRTLPVEEVAGTPTGDRYMAIDRARDMLGFAAATTLEEGLRAYCNDTNLV